MIHPIPPGTRDVLPDEMREQRAITDGLHGRSSAAGYGEVWTPTLEYEEVLGTGDAGASGYRLFDDQGDVLALRSDMTLPIARLAATRYPDAEPPLRLCYFGHAYRSARRGSGQATEFLQAGVELLGVPGPDGEAEVIDVLLQSLEAAGLARHRVGLGDSALYRELLANLEVPAEHHADLLARLAGKDLVGLEMRVQQLGLLRRRAAAAVAPARDARRPRDAGARARGGRPGAGRPGAAVRDARGARAWPTG